MATLQVMWFLLVGVLLAGYAVLDGFDLGVGFWHLWTRRDNERRQLLNAIGPFWDGNEVWLLTGGGALFAAFPHVYATVFSGLYLALFLVLLCLILRAVAIEFRSQVESPRWRSAWDVTFALGSSLPALLFGVALGNILRGLPLDSDMTYTGTFLTLLNPYALLIGATGLAMLVTHGALYISLRVDGDLAQRARRWALLSWGVFTALFVVAVVATILGQQQLLSNYLAFPLLFVVPLLALTAVLAIGWFLRGGRNGRAFLASVAAILSLLGMCGAGLFPHLVPALGNGELGLTIYNASSSQLTLTVMLVLALVGMPLVVAYTVWSYRTFTANKVGEEGY